MKIELVEQNKKQFLDLLLLADEQESMIDRYLQRGELFALYDGDLKAVCVVTCEGPGIYELKNIATHEKYQGMGFGKSLLMYIMKYYAGRGKTLFAGTGDNAAVASFYEHLGFEFSHRIVNFFPDHYHQPIFENGKQLIDMVYYKIRL